MHRHLRSGLFARLLAVAPILVAFATPARADTVYVVSQSTGGLFRFEASNPAGTITVISAPGTFDTPTALALGPDGHLYVGESGSDPAFAPRIRRVIVTGSTATISTAVILTGTDQSIYGESGKLAPAAITFRRPSDGGQMLVGRNPEPQLGQSTGPVVKVTDWNTEKPTVVNFTIGTALNSSPGLAVSASDGALYVSNSAYGGGGQSIVGQVERFDAAVNPALFVSTVVSGSGNPIANFGPTGLAVFGSTLYSASTQSSSVYATNLTTGQTSLLGTIQPDFAIAFGFDVGALARLSNGDLLTGSVSGFNPSLYLVPASGTGQLLNPYFTYADFGSIGGIALVPVPEPTALALAATAAVGLGWRCSRRRLRRM
jgi:hypothetical protein